MPSLVKVRNLVPSLVAVKPIQSQHMARKQIMNLRILQAMGLQVILNKALKHLAMIVLTILFLCLLYHQ